jgi:hypothetical protein
VLLREVIEPHMAEPDPAFEYFIHPVARRLQVGGYVRVRPADAACRSTMARRLW